jgi:hypothetical protein
MSRGIGAYFSQPGGNPGPRQGVGAYYSPSPLRPIPPVSAGMETVQATEGWDSLDTKTKSFLAIVGLVALGFFLLRGQK